jgi:lysozyme
MKLTVRTNTIFKKNSTSQASSIPNTHKLAIAKGQEFSVLASRVSANGHITVTLDEGLGPNNWNTWTVYSSHITIEDPSASIEEQIPDYPLRYREHRDGISKEGIDLIKKYEGFRSSAYLCPSGVWTLGYGFTSGVRKGQTITRKAADTRLDAEVKTYEDAVLKACKIRLSQGQLDALTSLSFNIGAGAIARSSAVRFHNRGEFQKAADAILLWNKGGGRILTGLVMRRAEERQLYLRELVHDLPN